MRFSLKQWHFPDCFNLLTFVPCFPPLLSLSHSSVTQHAQRGQQLPSSAFRGKQLIRKERKLSTGYVIRLNTAPPLQPAQCTVAVPQQWSAPVRAPTKGITQEVQTAELPHMFHQHPDEPCTAGGTTAGEHLLRASFVRAKEQLTRGANLPEEFNQHVEFNIRFSVGVGR